MVKSGFLHYTVKLALKTPAQYGHLIIMDSLRCPRGLKALAISLNSTGLIRTLSMAFAVSVLTRFDCMLLIDVPLGFFGWVATYLSTSNVN